MTTYSARVLSSYIFDDESLAYTEMGRRNRWVTGFVKSLVRNRSGLKEFDLQFRQTPKTRDDLDAIVRQWRDEGVQLIICPGTDSAIRLAELEETIPIIYFGAHPENNGLELSTRPNVAGIRLNLPLIWSYEENFALLKQAVPTLQRVYFALNLESEFAFPNVRVVYRAFREKSSDFWIPGDSPFIGYRSVFFLAQRAGLQYFEGPYGPISELERGLREADLENAALVGFNDTILNEGATDLLLRFSESESVPLVWVNNPSVIERYGVADFSSDFEAVGQVVGRLALEILRDGRSPADILLQEDPGATRVLNLRRAKELGIKVPDDVQEKFTEVIL